MIDLLEFARRYYSKKKNWSIKPYNYQKQFVKRLERLRRDN